MANVVSRKGVGKHKAQNKAQHKAQEVNSVTWPSMGYDVLQRSNIGWMRLAHQVQRTSGMVCMLCCDCWYAKWDTQYKLPFNPLPCMAKGYGKVVRAQNADHTVQLDSMPSMT